MKKTVKLSGEDVKNLVNKIIVESKKNDIPARRERKTVKEAKILGTPKKTGRVIRLTESELITFLDELSTKVENANRRRNSK